MAGYDAGAIQRYFDTLAEGEWARLEGDLRGRISYLVHRRFLLEHARAGMRALDVGCGPGRFALDLLETGCRVTLTDLSPVQLQLAKTHIEDAGFAVDGAHVDDISAPASLPDGPFDLVVAYGGVLSYTYDRHQAALDNLVARTAPGGCLLLSVMPLGGSMRLIAPLDAAGFLADWEQHMLWDRSLPRPGYVLTAPGSSEWHQPIALFSAAYLTRELERRACEVVTIAAASPICTLFPTPSIEANPTAAERLAELELALCDTPELAESGTHMVVAARKQQS